MEDTDVASMAPVHLQVIFCARNNGNPVDGSVQDKVRVIVIGCDQAVAYDIVAIVRPVDGDLVVEAVGTY